METVKIVHEKNEFEYNYQFPFVPLVGDELHLKISSPDFSSNYNEEVYYVKKRKFLDENQYENNLILTLVVGDKP